MEHAIPAIPAVVHDWLTALEARHLADLRVAEVTRALRALSSAYVQRRHAVAAGATLDSRGKRAAFALFYAPLHLLTTWHVVHALGAAGGTGPVLDLGCGTGAAGAAWALAGGGTVSGIDRHPWAVAEARWTYNALGISGHARQADVARLAVPRAGQRVIAGHVLNELPPAARHRVEEALWTGAAGGASILVIEPIARAITPWWKETAARVQRLGGRADEWRFAADLPPLLRTFDRAAGLDHRVLTARSLFIGR